jgi:hypothetical protein
LCSKQVGENDIVELTHTPEGLDSALVGAFSLAVTDCEAASRVLSEAVKFARTQTALYGELGTTAVWKEGCPPRPYHQATRCRAAGTREMWVRSREVTHLKEQMAKAEAEEVGGARIR